MKNYKSLIIFALALTFLASCSKQNCVSGSGSYVSKDYNPSFFNALSINGEADVIVVKDSVHSLRIEAQNNILNALNVEVKNQTLTIGEDNCFENASRLKVYISTPTLVGLTSAGSVNIGSSDLFKENVFNANLSGTGSMNVKIDVQEFNASTSGDGQILASGLAKEQYLRSSGDGFFRCFDLVGDHVDIDVSGKATMEVYADKTLNIDVSGSATIYYKGIPSITQDVSGTATIIDAN